MKPKFLIILILVITIPCAFAAGFVFGLFAQKSFDQEGIAK